MQLELHSSSPLETRALAAALGRALMRSSRRGEGTEHPTEATEDHALDQNALVLLLRGDFGSGKTTFVQGLAGALGISGAVRSPSYLIVKVYDEGRVRLVHADLYRSRGSADIAELGLEDLLAEGERGAVLAVEWPGENLPLAEELPTVWLRFSAGAGSEEDARAAPAQDGAEQRQISVEWTSDCIGLVSAWVEEMRSAPAA